MYTLYWEYIHRGLYSPNNINFCKEKATIITSRVGGGADASLLLVPQPTNLTVRFSSPKKENHVWGFLFNSTSTLCMKKQKCKEGFFPLPPCWWLLGAKSHACNPPTTAQLPSGDSANKTAAWSRAATFTLQWNPSLEATNLSYEGN